MAHPTRRSVTLDSPLVGGRKPPLPKPVTQQVSLATIYAALGARPSIAMLERVFTRSVICSVSEGLRKLHQGRSDC